MGSLLFILVIFLLLGGVLRFAFSMIGFTFKLVFWILGLVFGIIGSIIGISLISVFGILIVFVPVFWLMRRH